MADKPAIPKKWKLFMERCLDQRLDLDRFISLFRVLRRKQPSNGGEIIRALLHTQCGHSVGLDPLAVLYVDQLLQREQLEGSDTLIALLEVSHFRPTQLSPIRSGEAHEGVPPEFEEALLGTLSKLYTNSVLPKSKQEIQRCLKICGEWLNAVVAANTDAMLQNMTGTFQPAASETVIIRLAFGTLLISMLENVRISAAFNAGLSKKTTSILGKGISSITPILAETSIQHANRLDIIQKTHSCLQDRPERLEGNDSDQVSALGEVRLNEIADVQTVLTRAHLFVYLDAVLTGLPLVNDSAMLNYLHGRFKGDENTLIVNLTTAAFDLLAIAAHRGDTVGKLFIPRSFVVNKLPLLLHSISSMSFAPLSFEFLLSSTLSQLDPSLFPSFSQGLGMGNNNGILSEARQEFLFACALHGMISEDSIERLLGENPMQTLPENGKKEKSKLLAEYRSSPKKYDDLVHGLKAMDGNAQAVADAVTELLRDFCNAQETSSLKLLCSVLWREPLAIDALALLTGLGHFLAPLCQILDDWQHGEEQGENRIVYEEFSACSLLLMACVRRYNLRIEDILLEKQDGIVANLIDGRLCGYSISELSDQDKTHLEAWVRELFENEAISDEILAKCSPQEFYKLAPTILKQSILACKHHGLEVSSLKSGLELLLQPIILPSLIASIEWLCTHMWEQHGDRDVVLPILEKLIYPKNMSGDAGAMHDTFLEVIAIPLKQSLDQDSPGEEKKVSPLLTKLRPHLDYCQALGASRAEIQSWSSDMRASLFNRVRNDLNALSFWSSAASTDAPLPNYSHRQLCAAVQLCGASTVTRELVQWIQTHEESGNAAIALDIACALVCTPIQISGRAGTRNQRSTSGTDLALEKCLLRQALKVELEDATKAILKNGPYTVTAVQLSRRVEAQLAEPALPTLNHIPIPDVMEQLVQTHPVPDLDTQAPANELSLDFANSQDMLGLNLDVALANDASASEILPNQFEVLPTSAEDDIFSGLPGLDGLDADLDLL